MILKICSIYDKRMETFGTPFTVNHAVQASDAFNEAVENPQSFLNKHPHEYILYCVGTFDDQTGHVLAQPAPIVLAQIKPEV